MYKDRLIRGIVADGDVRVAASVTTATVSEGVSRHGMSPTAAAAYGRLLTGALLLGTGQKEFDRLTIRIDSRGAIGGIVAETTSEGTVRGYVKNPRAELPPNDQGKFDVSGIVGKGMLYVTKEMGFDVGLQPEPYVGSAPIVSGELAEDLAHYLAVSEQIPSAVMLGVLLNNRDPFVAAAGGVMIQMMPKTSDHIVTMIEDTVGRSAALTDQVRNGATPEDLASAALGELGFTVLEETDISFACNCSYDRARSLVASLGEAEVRSMLTDDRRADMNCGFCNEDYELPEEELRSIIRDLEQSSGDDDIRI